MNKAKRTSLMEAVNPTAPIANEKVKTERAERQSRKDTRIVSGHFDLSVSKQLKQIAAEEDATIQELLREALNDLFVKKNRLPIA